MNTQIHDTADEVFDRCNRVLIDETVQY